ncbi:MAG: helix-turn-helix transcriptional regulator [Formivibrio sp.]|nr:helix-turn-helix transcriptional regulator [Formivibrio sp.]
MAKDICAATGVRIRKLRRARSWRQIDLAEQSGVHEVHISDLERGAREPGLRTLSKIAAALDTTLSELLKGL